MGDIETEITFLADDPLYEKEKPYFIVPIQGGAINPDVTQVTNIKYDRHMMTITDIRPSLSSYTLEEHGFQLSGHISSNLAICIQSDIDRYKRETEQHLLSVFPDAVAAFTWDFLRRKNVPAPYNVFELDELRVEAPAIGAHNATFNSGAAIIKRYLPPEARTKFLRQGYRFRIVNTWRPLNEVLEDNPLAFCSFRSVSKQDLVPCDRVYPMFVGEVYMLRYSKAQRWHWVSRQTREEPLITIMFDTAGGPQARFCPHVSVHNPLAPPGCDPRESIETRSVVVSKM